MAQAELTLVIADRNYSGWSLRPWILMRHLEVQFNEVALRIESPDFKDEIARVSPSGRAPALRHGDLTIWDSMAIIEYVHEMTGRAWPDDRAARAVARSVCAEMHSGFSNLRMEWPVNARARNRHTPMTPGLEADIERIDELWNDCRRRFGAGGPWLFGTYSAADAMYAPVVLRFNTYRAQSHQSPLSETARWYMATALEDPALQEWVKAAQQDKWTIAEYEVG